MEQIEGRSGAKFYSGEEKHGGGLRQRGEASGIGEITRYGFDTARTEGGAVTQRVEARDGNDAIVAAEFIERAPEHDREMEANLAASAEHEKGTGSAVQHCPDERRGLGEKIVH